MARPKNTTGCSVSGCARPVKSWGWCSAHYSRWRRYGDPAAAVAIVGNDAARFWSHVNKAGPVPAHRPDIGPCWLYSAKFNGKGYAQIKIGGIKVAAHRWAYEQVGQRIPEGLEIDHLCRVRNCVRSSHLEPVTHAENIARAMKNSPDCPKGHPLSGENLYTWKRRRYCRACLREWSRLGHRRKRQEARLAS